MNIFPQSEIHNANHPILSSKYLLKIYNSKTVLIQYHRSQLWYIPKSSIRLVCSNIVIYISSFSSSHKFYGILFPSYSKYAGVFLHNVPKSQLYRIQLIVLKNISIKWTYINNVEVLIYIKTEKRLDFCYSV